MGCRQSKADAVVGSTAALAQREARGSLRDDLTSDLIQHKYVDDINEFFEFNRTIGTGHFGCVKHAVSKKSGKEWAVKVVALSNEVDRDALRNEINILKRLHHPQIVRVIASYEDKEHMYMIMQLCKATIDDTMGNIYDGVLIFENDVWSKFSPASILFIKSLVKENVDQRLSAEQALEHKWLNEGEMASADGSGAARLQSDKCMLLTNMLSFSQCRKMKQAALLSVALGISEDHIQQEMAAEVFHSMDRTKKGSLSCDEFCSALVECGVSNADAGELFTRINQSKSGNINYLEFMAAVMDQRDIGQSTIKEAFGILDGEKQGRLSLVGLQDLFKNSMVAEEVKDMIASVDTKGDGYVDFEAFQGLFTASLPQVAEEDSSTTASIGNGEAESPEKPMVTSQSFCTRNTESTVDSITDRTTPSSTSSPVGYTSEKTEESEAIKAEIVHQNDVNVSMVNA
ncbi:hypothetical protein PC113_g6704 [Phytophthora cactorum]|uniref:non-specific serine/threonine protein kinase n=1 Tax=Phytophthora cactorum TaxID=29920 RepID=A0A8T0ZHY8_9STRA|nr:hypothetical protein PC113_g6704 [Phytophthora cactorum]